MPTTSAAPASTSVRVSRALPQPASSTEPAAEAAATICGTPNGGTSRRYGLGRSRYGQSSRVLPARRVSRALTSLGPTPGDPRRASCGRVHEGHRVDVEELRPAVGDGGGGREAFDEWAR